MQKLDSPVTGISYGDSMDYWVKEFLSAPYEKVKLSSTSFVAHELMHGEAMTWTCDGPVAPTQLSPSQLDARPSPGIISLALFPSSPPLQARL